MAQPSAPLNNSAELLQALNHLQEVVFKINVTGQWLFLNQRWTEFTDYSVEECLGQSWLTHVHPQDHDICHEYLRRVSKGQPESLAAPIRIITKKNAFRWVKIRASVLPCENPKIFNLTGTLTDISEEKSENERQIANYRALFSLINNVPGMVYRCRNNRDWTMAFVSAGCRDLTGYDAEYITNSTSAWSDMIHPEAREYVWMTIQSAIQNQQHFELTYRIVTADGHEKWVWEHGIGSFSANGELLGLDGLITDITDTKRQSLSVERDTLFDPTTHLATQHLFLNRIQHAIELASEKPNSDHSFSVAIININQHNNADDQDNDNSTTQISTEISARLNSILSPSATLCQLNKNEFGVLLEHGKTQEKNISRSIRSIQGCLKAPIKLYQNTFYTKVSIGIVQFNEHSSNSDVMRDANRASAQAREYGKNKIEFADEQQNTRMATIIGTESELATALDTDQLTLTYQALTPSEKTSNQVLAVKIAWQHPRRGMISAEHFYNYIDDLELIRKLGQFILKEAGNTLSSLPESITYQQIYLHGLGESILNGELISECVQCLSDIKSPPHWQHNLKFIIDIDHSLLTNLSDHNLKNLHQLDQHGIGIAVTGLKAAGAYTELLELPGIAAIKFDMTNANSLGITASDTHNAIAAYYHAMNIQVIAEGPSTAENRHSVETWGFDFLQSS